MKNKTLLLEQVLGDDWDQLPSVIRKHYTVSDNNETCLKGEMEIGYPNFLLPLIYLIHLFGGLISLRGKKISTTVKKTSSELGTRLNWQRTLKVEDRTEDTFFSHMIFSQSHEVIEYVRFGFGLKLIVSVENGDLVYRSNGHIWQCGFINLVFPDWLLLGKATIIEHKINDQQFSLDFSIKHPIWGVSYWYKGLFQH